MRKVIFLTVGLAGFIFLKGCSRVYHTARGFGQGISLDTRSVWKKMVKADKWVEENTW